MIDVLWPDSYRITVGDEECEEIEIRKNEIICLPPKSKPFDPVGENPRVRVCAPILKIKDCLKG